MNEVDLFFELIRVALGRQAQLSAVPTAEQWLRIQEIATRQTLLGVAFTGVERLPKEQCPPREQLLRWYAMVMQIEKRNQLMNERSVYVFQQFLHDGYRGCILKGQGNALMYPQPLRRQSGDIDIWLDGNRTDLLRYTLDRFPHLDFKYQHIDFPALKDVAIELHFFPMYMQNPLGNWHLQRFFRRYKEEVFEHFVDLPDEAGMVAIPTARFNAVYQLTHLFIHFIIEGIGLRHFVDYYYVLTNLAADDRAMVVRELKRINLYGFSKAVMYVLREILGMEDEQLIAPVDEKNGRRLVEEILQAGNFGHYETRYWKRGDGFAAKQWQKIRRNSHFLFTYPGEIACEPFFRLYHATWRWWTKTFVV